MLFEYSTFLEELRVNESPEKRKIIERWGKISLANSFEEEPYYAYLKKFKVKDIPYKVPEDLSEEFEWQLLFQLVAGSFSTDYQISYPNLDDADDVVLEDELPELCISVKSGNISITRTISELLAGQILRLYEIYLEEEINLHLLKCEHESEENSIDIEREMRLKKFNHLKTGYLKHKNDLKQRNIRQKIFNCL